MFEAKLKPHKKMRDLGIFQNKIQITQDNKSVTVLHVDEIPSYNGWFLTTYHGIDQILWRGESKDIPSQYKDFLTKIGNPKNVIITKSQQDTY